VKNREAMVLIFNSTLSREISVTNFTPTHAITYIHGNISLCLDRFASNFIKTYTSKKVIALKPHYCIMLQFIEYNSYTCVLQL